MVELVGEDKEIVRGIEIVKKYHDEPRYFIKGNYNRHPLRVSRILVEEFEERVLGYELFESILCKIQKLKRIVLVNCFYGSQVYKVS